MVLMVVHLSSGGKKFLACNKDDISIRVQLVILLYIKPDQALYFVHSEVRFPEPDLFRVEESHFNASVQCVEKLSLSIEHNGRTELS